MTPEPMTPAPALTPADLQRWAADHARLASAVLAARVFAEAERARVDAYSAPILARYGFKVSARFGRHEAGALITRTEDLYLVDDLKDAEIQAFYAELDAAHRARGFDGPAGHCPALTADTLHREAERALLDAGSALFGAPLGNLHGDKRAEAVKLLIGACVASGRVENLFKAPRAKGAR